MDIIEFREYCLQLPGVTESTPFGDNTLVFKVMGKMFAACDIEEFESINLKCEPEKAIQLRAEYPQIKPGYHMNKKHWNTVDSTISSSLLIELTNHSYDLVVAGLPKKLRAELGS